MSFLKAGKYACYEFERKFLLKKIPFVVNPLTKRENHELSLKDTSAFIPSKHIEDRYFLGTSLRLRIIWDDEGTVLKRKLTQKYISPEGHPSKTIITTLYLTEEEAHVFLSLEGAFLRKTRYTWNDKGVSYAIDLFKGPLQGLILAEVEFETEKQMKDFKTPFKDWIEVTNNLKYTGGSLAQQGLP
jgi:CYTH domain-containing protein